jgi:hypothetical protein
MRQGWQQAVRRAARYVLDDSGRKNSAFMPACVQHGSSFGLPEWRALHLSSQAPLSAWALNRRTFRHRTLSNVERSQVAVLHFAYRACFATERVFTITQAPIGKHLHTLTPILSVGSGTTLSCTLAAPLHPHPVMYSGIHIHTLTPILSGLYSGSTFTALTPILSCTLA